MRHVNISALETELWNWFLTLAYSKTVNISGFYITSKHLMWKNSNINPQCYENI